MLNLPSWLRPSEDGSILLLYIQPGASRTQLLGIHGGRLKLKVKAPPIDGKANIEVVEFVAELLEVSKSKVELLRGESSRTKDVKVRLSPQKVISFSSNWQL